MSNWWKVIVVLFFPVFLWTYFSKGPQEAFTPVFRVSDDPVVAVPDGQDYTFGYLEVLEDRSKPTGPTIQLPIYWFKSRSQTPARDPVIYTVGGPGYSSMSAAQYMAYYAYLDDRDLILFEQRGTEYAQPPLNCPEWAEAALVARLPHFSSSQRDSIYVEAARACRTQLTDQGINLNSHNTVAIAQDIEDLRRTLGIEKYNLLTISYSTKIAQVLMRDYPGTIRSVVMDSALPLESNYDLESVRNLVNVLNKIWAACHNEPECDQTYPDLKQRLEDFLARCTADPLELTIRHPDTNESLLYRLKGKDIIAMISPGSIDEINSLPARVQTLLAGDYTALSEALTGALSYPPSGTGRGMRLSVWCAEEFAFVSAEQAEQETHRYPYIDGLSPAVFSPAVCKAWNVMPAPARENEPVISSIPTLFINGEFDEQTPSDWASAMQPNFSNSFHLVFPGWHHTPTTNWSNPCAMACANAFFNDPGRKPELACLKELAKIAVFGE